MGLKVFITAELTGPPFSVAVKFTPRVEYWLVKIVLGASGPPGALSKSINVAWARPGSTLAMRIRISEFFICFSLSKIIETITKQMACHHNKRVVYSSFGFLNSP
jgi:hypothetical protein